MEDQKCGEYLCMLLSTCFTCADAVESMINDESRADFIQKCLKKLTSVFEEKESEWAVFATQKLWNVHGFAIFMSGNTIEENIKSFSYQILSNAIEKEGAREEKDGGDFSDGLRSNLSALGEYFSVEASEMFSTSSSDAQLFVEFDRASSSRNFSELLDVLCVASSSADLLPELQSCLKLVMTTTTILIQVIATSPILSSSPSSSVESRGPFHRDVIRLLGNLCWKHRRNQDAVRDLNGIPAVLSSFNVDESSPFVRQWAVFALRNLCEDNLENQGVVAGIQLRGVTDREGVLEEMGLEIELDGGKPRLRRRD